MFALYNTDGEFSGRSKWEIYAKDNLLGRARRAANGAYRKA
jgi:hypothetical protein